MTAVTLVPVRPGLMPGVGSLCGYNIVVLLFSYVPRRNVPCVGFVGWEPHSGRKQSCFFFLPSPGVNVF